jgi:hypothetical protein
LQPVPEGQIGEPLLDYLGSSSETSSINYFAVFAERAVMAPDVAKVDANRHLDHGLSVWGFCEEVIPRLFHGKQSLRSGGPAHPISRQLDRALMASAEGIESALKRKFNNMQVSG